MSNPGEIVDPAKVGGMLALLSGLALVFATALVIYGRIRGSASLFRAGWGTAALVLLYPLWLTYNRIEDQFGLDSVAALALNGILFAGIGVAAGLFARRLRAEGLTEGSHRGDAESAEKARG